MEEKIKETSQNIKQKRARKEKKRERGIIQEIQNPVKRVPRKRKSKDNRRKEITEECFTKLK